MTETLQGVDTIVHLAALSGVMDSVEDPCPSFESTLLGHSKCSNWPAPQMFVRVINASTGGALLGEVASPISEEMAPCPLSPYGASKLAVEGYCSPLPLPMDCRV